MEQDRRFEAPGSSADSEKPKVCVEVGQCGARGVKFLKLHKVGSSTVATAIEEYALRHSCTY